MELLNSFLGQGIVAQIGEIVLFANTVTMAMPTREFHRQDMESIFKKKIKTRFPILFKRAVEFHLMKARSRLR